MEMQRYRLVIFLVFYKHLIMILVLSKDSKLMTFIVLHQCCMGNLLLQVLMGVMVVMGLKITLLLVELSRMQPYKGRG